AFNICTFWRIDALARIGRREEAREIFEAMLAARNPLGLLAEDTHPITGEMWGNSLWGSWGERETGGTQRIGVSMCQVADGGREAEGGRAGMRREG
ncbi:hypothetical protein K4H00_21640, partial [Mycobacterium tuberculosis]|nr:hypothetical protein [Mycobacterium tuberculosis]